jgi:hypothetical protein
MNLSEAKHAGHDNPGLDYDRAHAELATVEQTSPCTCQRKAKARTGSVSYPSLISIEDADPDCELHFPWVIEDEAMRRLAMRYWMAGYQVGFDTASGDEQFEIVVFDPEDSDTYPSVCADPDEVKSRFGFTGGERLLFNMNGAYIAKLTKELPV